MTTFHLVRPGITFDDLRADLDVDLASVTAIQSSKNSARLILSKSSPKK